MKNRIWGAVPTALLTAWLAVASNAAHADRLDDIKRAGVLRVAEGLTTLPEVLACTPLMS